MGRESLKQKAEAWLMQAVKGGGMLPPDIQIVHAESGEHAKSERIIIEASVGEALLEVKGSRPDGTAFEGYPVDIDVELRSTNRNADEIDDIFAAIEIALATPNSIAAAGLLFDGLEFFPERMSVAGSRGRNTRNRSRKFPFVIVEKNVASANSR